MLSWRPDNLSYNKQSLKWKLTSFVIIPIYIQQDATLHSLFYLETALHVSGGTSIHHQEHIQLYVQHLLLVTPLLLPAAIVEELGLIWVCCGWRTPSWFAWKIALAQAIFESNLFPYK
jgi:hypothetical protein